MAKFTWDHIHLRTTDPEAMAQWFEKTLGAEVLRTMQQGKPRIDLKIGGANIFIAPVAPGDRVNAAPTTPYRGLDHFGLAVTGIDAIAADLKAKGVEFTREPTTIRPCGDSARRLSSSRFRRRRLRCLRKQGPIQFLENNPIQSSFWVRFMCPKTRRNRLRLPILRFSSGVQLPPAAALRRSHTRSRRPPPFPSDSCVSWHTVNLRSAASSAIIRTSEHFHVFPPPPRLSVRMFGSGGKKRAIASSNCAAL